MISALCVFFTTENAYAFEQPGVVKWEWLENERLSYSELALNADFCCPEPVRYKLLQHFQKFLGEALNLACERTNKRADRNLKGKSVRYKKYWKPLKVGARLWTLLSVWFGTAILDIIKMINDFKEHFYRDRLDPINESLYSDCNLILSFFNLT